MPTPTSTPSPSPPTTFGSATDYLVKDVGATWRYKGTDQRRSPPSTYFNTVRFIQAGAMGGAAVSSFTRSNPLGALEDMEYLYADSNGLWSNTAIGSAAFDPTQSKLEIAEPVQLGLEKTAADLTDKSQDLDGDGKLDTMRLVVSLKHVGIEAVTVEAGVFSRSLRVDKVAVATIDTAAGQRFTNTARQSSWFAPGIGLIKRLLEDPGFKAPNNIVVEELAGFVNATKSGGIVPTPNLGFTWKSDPSIGPSDKFKPIVLTGTGLALVAAPVSDIDPATAIGNTAFRIAASLISSKGQVVWSGLAAEGLGTSAQPLAGAFDGTNFWLTWAELDGVWLQRITQTGLLLEGSRGKLLIPGGYAPNIYLSSQNMLMSWIAPWNAQASGYEVKLAAVSASTGALSNLQSVMPVDCNSKSNCENSIRSAIYEQSIVFMRSSPLNFLTSAVDITRIPVNGLLFPQAGDSLPSGALPTQWNTGVVLVGHAGQWTVFTAPDQGGGVPGSLLGPNPSTITSLSFSSTPSTQLLGSAQIVPVDSIPISRGGIDAASTPFGLAFTQAKFDAIKMSAEVGLAMPLESGATADFLVATGVFARSWAYPMPRVAAIGSVLVVCWLDYTNVGTPGRTINVALAYPPYNDKAKP